MVGRPMPNPTLAAGQRLDEALDRGFNIVVSEANRQRAGAAFSSGSLAALGAALVTVEAERFPFLVDDNHVTVVRPDRLIAAVLDLTNSEAIAAFDQLVTRWVT
jgi:hypothetical protein